MRVRVDSNAAAGTELAFRSAFIEIGTSPLCIYYGADRTVRMGNMCSFTLMTYVRSRISHFLSNPHFRLR